MRRRDWRPSDALRAESAAGLRRAPASAPEPRPSAVSARPQDTSRLSLKRTHSTPLKTMEHSVIYEHSETQATLCDSTPAARLTERLSGGACDKRQKQGTDAGAQAVASRTYLLRDRVGGGVGVTCARARKRRQTAASAPASCVRRKLSGLALCMALLQLAETICAAPRNQSHAQDWRAGSARLPRSGDRSAKLLELDALNYLQRYGYMNSTPGALNLIAEDAFHEAVTQFQRFAGIQESGTLDALTVKYMQMPRCGNRDLAGKGENGRRRRKRYALQGSKWRRQELTYRVSQYPTRFLHKRHEVDSQIERAFRIWSQVAPIDFVVRREGRVHIDIRFASGEHGDGDPFDGPGNTLAHAYFPQYGGDAHFDDQEYWTVDSHAGTNIFQVAAHELGHSLGLGHSSVREALMAPFYQKYKPNFKLHADDVLAIQALYGERPSDEAPATSATPSEAPRRRPTQAPAPASEDESSGGAGGSGSRPANLCQDPQIDAITRTEDGNTFVFKGHHYWQLTNEGLASGSPGRIARDWDGLPGNLDAALTWSDGKTFFFKGDKYWRFSNKRREPGYPKLISVGFAGIPGNLDAAFVWGGNGKTYFVKRDKYWRFDSKQEPPVSGQYPKALKNWAGLPASVDAAFKWENGMTYFFKDELYYRFDDREFEVDGAARPPFPRSTAEWWFGCTGSNLPVRRAPNDNEVSESSDRAAASPAPSERRLEWPVVGERRASLSRSLLSSLSALLPSTSSDTPDWSFHRGLGEEVRKLFKAASGSRPAPADDATRWVFPGAGISGGSTQSGAGNRLDTARERSLSELKLAPAAREQEE